MEQKTKLENVVLKFAEHFYLEPEVVQTIKATMITAISQQIPADPLWIFITGPAGSLKTEIVRAFGGHPKVLYVGDLTEKSLVSGKRAKGEKDPSLAAKLDGKIFAIKDFTTVISARIDEKGKIFATLRDIYDGETSKAFGTKVFDEQEDVYKTHCTLIAGVTPVIDTASLMNQKLGERFLKVRPRYKEPQKAIAQARHNVGKLSEIREDVKKTVHKFLDDHTLTLSHLPPIPPELDQKINALSHFLAVSRTTVERDWRTGAIEYMPETEIGTRITQQLTKLVQCSAYLEGRPEVTKDDYCLAFKVAEDSIPNKCRRAIQVLYHQTPIYAQSTQELAQHPLMRLETDTTRRVFEELVMLGIAQKEIESANWFKWRMQEDFRKLIDSCSIENHLPYEEVEQSDIPF